MEKVDIAIIGGGIAGLSLGKFLAEKGLPFVIFEEHNEFFRKACGEGITQKIAGYDFLDLYGSKKGVEKEIPETIIYTKYGEIFLEMPILMIDKNKVEEEFAKKAEEQGEIRKGEKVKKIENGILFPQNVKAKLIVGADGFFSITRKYINVRNPKEAFAVEACKENIEKDDSKCHVVLRDSVIKHGYAWYFPKKGKWNIGIGSFNKKYFREGFEKFKKENNGLEWRGAYIPMGKPLRSYGKNAILIGDACCQVFSNVGAGNMPSIICSYIASECIEKWVRNGNYELEEYERKCRNVLGKQLKYSYYAGIIFFKLIKSEYMRHKILEKMCKSVSNFYRKMG
ncbi:MAG: NAD(P)/FAD-dependent oxidoreductase [Thermoplasmatales archaeon]|nr:NAD(P)/FAD-dependent oxidoreductase [Thermoplasmatales archaeon]